MKTYVDGGVYDYEGSEESVVVRDALGELVATANIDDNVEQIFVTWYFEDGDTVEGEYPYFEYNGNDEALVVWMVSCHPING